MSSTEDTNTPGSGRSTRNCSKCNLCGRVFRNPEAMAVHKASMHKTSQIKALKTATVKTTTISESDIAKLAYHAKKPKHIVRSTPQTEAAASPNKITVSYVKHGLEVKEVKKGVTRKNPVVKENVDNKSDDIKPIIFHYKCPKCNDLFVTFMKAYKHIQDNHPFNKRGEKVESGSEDMIQPIKLNLKEVVNSETKKKLKEVLSNILYQCYGCKQCFSTEKQFLLHISSLHTQEMDSFFFTSACEFLSWKQEMEAETKIDFTCVTMFDTRQYYRCKSSGVALQRNRNTVPLCPSTIIVQEYLHGRQVHFYRQHAGHACKPYVIHEKYRKNFLANYLTSETNTSFLASDAFSASDFEKDLYVQFKRLMESVVLEAAQLDIRNLKVLHNKALEMTKIIHEYAQRDRYSDDDDGIRVEAKVPVPVKRDMDSVVGKKIVQLLECSDDDDVKEEKYSDTFDLDKVESVEEPWSSERLRKRNIMETPIQRVVPSKRSKRSVTFNDSRKSAEFETTPKIVSTFSLRTDIEEKPLKVVKKEQKIEKREHKNDKKDPKNDKKDPKSDKTDSKNDKKDPKNDKKDPKNDKKVPKNDKKDAKNDKMVQKNEIQNDKDTGTPNSELPNTNGSWFAKSPTFSFNDTYKNFVEKNFSTPLPYKKILNNNKKAKIRTQLGMYKPGRNRSKSIDSSLSPKSTTSSPKVPIKVERYEVKERDNDCNILILKI